MAVFCKAKTKSAVLGSGAVYLFRGSWIWGLQISAWFAAILRAAERKMRPTAQLAEQVAKCRNLSGGGLAPPRPSLMPPQGRQAVAAVAAYACNIVPAQFFLAAPAYTPNETATETRKRFWLCART